MSKEELWQLFPIFLVSHQEVWKDWFNDEKNYISNLIPSNMIAGIHHIGSTAIPKIKAKNIVDILIVVKHQKHLEETKAILVNHGYQLMSEDDFRISLNKGYTEKGFADRVFHLHFRLNDDVDELYFRDFLCEHEDVVKAYENLKVELAFLYKHNRDMYTFSKTDFIKQYTEKAKLLYKGRY